MNWLYCNKCATMHQMHKCIVKSNKDSVINLKEYQFKLSCYYCLESFYSHDVSHRFCSNRCLKEKYGV